MSRANGQTAAVQVAYVPPPQDIDAEQNLLGALLVAGAQGPAPAAKTVADVDATRFDRRDFYYEGHALIFDAIVVVVANGDPCDVILVQEQLERSGQLENAGGSVRLRELAALAPATANAPHWAKRVSRVARARRGEDEEQVVSGSVFRSAADLLRQPDPGPTPFLVESLLVDQCLGVIQGSAKVGKTWTLLELARAIVTGDDAFGRFAVPVAGPVIVVLEESGEAALHRRLSALARGNAQLADVFEQLHYGANLRVKLDDPEWQRRLIDAAREITPKAIFLDPLVRMKGASREENSVTEMGIVLDFLGQLRDAVKTTVVFCHHTGHNGERLRGTSDLEAFWESKIAVKKVDVGREVKTEHREAEAGSTWTYKLAWDGVTRSMKLVADGRVEEIEERVRAYLAEHPDASSNEVERNVKGRSADVREAYKRAKEGCVPNARTHPDAPGSAPTSGCVPPAPLFRGAGDALPEGLRPVRPEALIDDAELERLEQLYEAMSGEAE